MIYIYNTEILASIKNRSLASYNEYNMLQFLIDPPSNRSAALNGIFYYYIHEIYDPLFLWNITEIKQLRIELGNNRFIGRSLRAQQVSEDRWLSTLLVSPEPWNYVIADIRVLALDKTLDIDFLSAERFKRAIDFNHGEFFDAVIRPYLKFPKVFDNIFGVNDNNTYTSYTDDNLSHSYILKNKDTVISILGNKDKPSKIYDIADYGSVFDTVSSMFADAETEIK